MQKKKGSDTVIDDLDRMEWCVSQKRAKFSPTALPCRSWQPKVQTGRSLSNCLKLGSDRTSMACRAAVVVVRRHCIRPRATRRCTTKAWPNPSGPGCFRSNRLSHPHRQMTRRRIRGLRSVGGRWHHRDTLTRHRATKCSTTKPSEQAKAATP